MADHYNEFRKRWNIPTLSEREVFLKFRTGILNSFKTNLKPVYSSAFNSIFCRRSLVEDTGSSVYGLSNIYSKISSSTNTLDLLFYSEVIINIFKDVIRRPKLIKFENFRSRFKRAKKAIIGDLEGLIEILPLGIIMKEEEKSILFYPLGAKLLDEKLVNDPLDWLLDYSKAHENFKTALEKYQRKIYKRNLMDDLRNSLEMFLKEFLGNQKSLEKQKKELLKYMKNQDVSPEITNMFWTLLDRYSKYQNEYVKHDDNVKEQEIEFMIYLTGNFIRFLILLGKK